MPEALERGLALKKLLHGDVDDLGEWLGSNYAHPARLQARACMVAANLRRHELMDDIRALADSDAETVRVCAEWAQRKLKSEG